MLLNAIILVYQDVEELDKLVIDTLSLIEEVLPKLNFSNQMGIVKLLSFIISIYHSLPGIFTPNP